MDHNMKIKFAIAIISLIVIGVALSLLPNILIYFISILLSIVGVLYWFKVRNVEKSEAERWLNRTLHFLHVPAHVQQRASYFLGLAHHEVTTSSSSNVHYSTVSSQIDSRTGRVKSDMNVSSTNFSSPRSRTHYVEKDMMTRTMPQNNSFSSPRERSVGVKTCQAVAGPTLASTRFKQNLDYSVYADVNSPGFSERIATYHQESNTEIPGSRYSCPGHFPSVRLLKDHVPQVAMETRPKGRSTVTVRVAPPLPDYIDTSLSSMVDQSRDESRDDNAPTHSVLDALKEISRKRIHGEESESDPKKRHKVDESSMSADDSGESRMSLLEANCKRGRDEDSPETRPQPRKRICSNEIASSLSSMRGKRKIIGASHHYCPSDEPSLNKKRSLAVFDEACLEPVQALPSSKLAESGTVGIEKDVQMPEAPVEEIDIQEAKSSTPLRPLFGRKVEVDKPSVSPEGVRQVFATIQTEETSVSPMACTGRDLREKKLKSLFSALKPQAEPPTAASSSAASLTCATTLTTSIASPVVSTAQHSTSSLVSAKSDLVATSSTEPQVSAALTLTTTLPENKQQSTLTAPVSVTSTTQQTPTFGTSVLKASVPTFSDPASNTLGFSSLKPPQPDTSFASKPQSSTALLSKPQVDAAFISSPLTDKNQSDTVLPTSAPTLEQQNSSTPNFAFGATTVPAVAPPSSTFVATSKPADTPSFGSQAFGIPTTATAAPTFNFEPASQAEKTSTTVATSFTSQTFTASPAFTNFGTPSSASAAFGTSFGPQSVSNTPAMPVSTSSSSFGTVTSSNFGAPSSTSTSFGTPSFGLPSSSKAPVISTSTSAAFGKPAVTSTNFGTPNPTPTAFGTPNFGVQPSSNASTISAAVSTAFGKPTGTPTNFGTPSSTTPTAFGTPSFGAQSSSNAPAMSTPVSTAFGTPTVASNTFGTPSSASTAFASSSFGAQPVPTSTPSFGSPFAPSLNTSSVTTAPPAFGSATLPLPSFGTQFGSPSGPQFGTASNTTPSAPPPAYGSQTSGSMFGAQSSASKPFMFGSQTSSPAFPSPVSTATTSFQTTASKPAFGGTFQFGGSSSVFGADGKAANPFGAPPNQSPFQQTSPLETPSAPFSAPSTTSVGGFSYPAPVTATAAKPFSFGAAKPSENQMFGGGAKPTAPQAFSFTSPSSNQQQGFAGPNSSQQQGFAGANSSQQQGFAGPNSSQQQGFAGPNSSQQAFAGPNSSQQQGFAGPNTSQQQGFAGPNSSQQQGGFAGPNSSQQQGFKFGGGSQQSTSSFGADSFSFGQSLNNPGLQFGAPQINSQPAGSAGGMFSIGAGASANRSRPGVPRRRKPN